MLEERVATEARVLTCDQICERARAAATVITQANYEAIAEAILPFVPKQQPPRQLSKAEQETIARLPEVIEEQCADLGMTTGDDWTDMVIVLVTTGQANAARNAFYARLRTTA